MITLAHSIRWLYSKLQHIPYPDNWFRFVIILCIVAPATLYLMAVYKLAAYSSHLLLQDYIDYVSTPGLFDPLTYEEYEWTINYINRNAPIVWVIPEYVDYVFNTQEAQEAMLKDRIRALL